MVRFFYKFQDGLNATCDLIKKSLFFDLLLMLAVLSQVFFNTKDTSNPFLSLILINSLFLTRIYKISYRIHSFIILILLFLMMILRVNGRLMGAEKSAVFVYLELILLIFSLAINKKYFSYKKIFQLIKKDIITSITLFNENARMFVKFVSIKKYGNMYLKDLLVSVFLIICGGVYTKNIYNSVNFFKINLFRDPYSQYFHYLGQYQLFHFAIVLVTAIIILFYVRNTQLKAYMLWIFFPTLLLLVPHFIYLRAMKGFARNPFITNISDDSFVIWQRVSIRGLNFGVAQYNDAEVYLNDKKQRVVRWEDKEIIFVVDANTESGELWIKNVDQAESNKINFTYTAP